MTIAQLELRRRELLEIIKSTLTDENYPPRLLPFTASIEMIDADGFITYKPVDPTTIRNIEGTPSHIEGLTLDALVHLVHWFGEQED